MAQLTRFAKPANRWGSRELFAYNISFTTIPPAEFFQSDPDPSLDHLDPAVFSPDIILKDSSLSIIVSGFLTHLDFVTYPNQQTPINDFATGTLRLLGFNERDIIIITRYNIPLHICGEEHTSATVACIIYCPTTVLLVLIEDKTLWNKARAEPQVVAQAIAAFQYNNWERKFRGQPILESMTIPCISMFGTNPTFYLVPVTEQLSTAVKTGQYPETETQVLRCITTTTHESRVGGGMVDVEFRKLALKRFLAFKSLAKSYWQKLLV